MKKIGKKGFTIIEIVIALTIISIVSITATSLVIASQQMSKKTRDHFFAIDLKDNSIAVFTSLVDVTDGSDLIDVFVNRIDKALELDPNKNEIERTDNETTITIRFDSDWEQSVKNVKHTCTIKLLSNEKKLSLHILIKANSVTVEDDYEIYAEGL